MKIQISDQLYKTFEVLHKNPNYALRFLLSGLDKNACPACAENEETNQLDYWRTCSGGGIFIRISS